VDARHDILLQWLNHKIVIPGSGVHPHEFPQIR
jgi:hypothetical protein